LYNCNTQPISVLKKTCCI